MEKCFQIGAPIMSSNDPTKVPSVEDFSEVFPFCLGGGRVEHPVR